MLCRGKRDKAGRTADGVLLSHSAGSSDAILNSCCTRLPLRPIEDRMKIGVLALQGDFDAHRRRLEELGAEVVLVKKPEQLDGIDGLVIPGGGSGTFLKLLGEEGFEKLKQFVRLKPTFGTCAGAILLATEVENPRQAGLGAIDIQIRRNAYGRQIDSSIREGKFIPEKLAGSPLEMVF